MTITLRDTKGSALTYAELDANFTHADLYKSVQNISGPGAISTTTGVTFISTTGERLLLLLPAQAAPRGSKGLLGSRPHETRSVASR